MENVGVLSLLFDRECWCILDVDGEICLLVNVGVFWRMMVCLFGGFGF